MATFFFFFGQLFDINFLGSIIFFVSLVFFALLQHLFKITLHTQNIVSVWAAVFEIFCQFCLHCGIFYCWQKRSNFWNLFFCNIFCCVVFFLLDSFCLKGFKNCLFLIFLLVFFYLSIKQFSSLRHLTLSIWIWIWICY